MTKKIKKSPEVRELERRSISRTIKQYPLNPEEIERELEIEFNEETGEVIFVTVFRFAWGDPLDADIEHVLSLDEAYDLARAILEHYEKMKSKVLKEKEVSIAAEGNPIKEHKMEG